MEKVFILILSLAVAIFIALPFLRNRLDESSSREQSNAAEIEDPVKDKLRKLNLEKESIFAAIKEIDFDYDLGKLSKDDYDELQKKYKLQAASILKEIDKIRIEADVIDMEGALEKEISLMKRAELTDEEEIEKEILMARNSGVVNEVGLICWCCGKESGYDDKFCSNCG
ncbi:MAG: hypothetical protein ACRENF_03215, partial [Thermodesulfobacteriota bacterium]